MSDVRFPVRGVAAPTLSARLTAAGAYVADISPPIGTEGPDTLVIAGILAALLSQLS
jgi:hypothetical protein